MRLPAIDAHAHVDVRIAAHELTALNAFIMAATRSLAEAEAAAARRDDMTIWGVGCHPAVVASVDAFEQGAFATLLRDSAFVGEVGLDRRSRVPMQRQVEVLGQILDVVAEMSRPVSLHSTGATGVVLDVLERHPIQFPILHWWRGTPIETVRAINLGCFFSLNGHEARSPKVISLVPTDRVLTETDFPHTRRYDPAADRPGAVATTERALAEQHGVGAMQLRERMWSTLKLLLTASPERVVSPVLRRLVASLPIESQTVAEQLSLAPPSSADHGR